MPVHVVAVAGWWDVSIASRVACPASSRLVLRSTCDVLPTEPPPVEVGPLRECSWSYDIVNSAMAAGSCGRCCCWVWCQAPSEQNDDYSRAAP
jgi:hypothetical protein